MFLDKDSAEEAFMVAVRSLCESQHITNDQKTHLAQSFKDNDYAATLFKNSLASKD
jgi:hypothetical protein